MNRLNIFESAIVGFFVGVIAAAYFIYLESMGISSGHILSTISLVPLFKMINVPGHTLIYTSFIFFVAVYTIYGAILGLIWGIGKKTKVTLIILVLVLLATIVFEQRGLIVNAPRETDKSNPALAFEVVHSIKTKVPEQYFGEIEAVGDLNADNIDDVAFVIPRKDPKKDTVYYLSAALGVKGGHRGTNLIYLGDGVEPKQIHIEDQKIFIEYKDTLDKKATTTTKVMYANVTDDYLAQIKDSK